MVKVALALVMVMWGLWQGSGEGTAPASETQAPAAEIQTLRYERLVQVPAGTAGEACAVLDAAVFAHAAGRALNDLRVFADDGREVPFALTESEAQPEETVSAEVRNVRVKGPVLLFDLKMPLRVSSTVELELAAKDFTAVATVTGEGEDGKAVPLGSYAIYDWTAKGLGRATELRLPEQGFAELHVSVQFYGAGSRNGRGDKPPRVEAEMIRGASVPPSREAQTLYTTVAETSSLQQEAGRSVARLALAAHVPVERVSMEMRPGFAGDFAHQVEVVAWPEGVADSAVVETVRGEVSTVHLPLYMDGDVAAATIRRMSVDAALAVNLRGPATVEVAIANRAAPLPVQAVRLEMRQRRVCFAALPGERYTLRYGDAGRVAPVYPQMVDGMTGAAVAMLGREEVNAAYHPRAAVAADRRVWVWVGLFAALSMLGGWVRHQRENRHG